MSYLSYVYQFGSNQGKIGYRGGGRNPLSFLVALVLVLLAANGTLLSRVNHLRSEVMVLRASQETPIGVRLPPISGHRISGEPVTVDLAKSTEKTLLFVLSPTCHICDANWPMWRALLTNLGPAVQPLFLDVSSGLTEQYAEHHQFPAAAAITKLDTKRLHNTDSSQRRGRYWSVRTEE